jgi:ATP-dependent helicase/nuclease subunit A
LQATLMAALELDGGRYASPYALGRSLRAGGVKAPVRADPQAVRLLTIHGAKGLEAQWVLMLDTDGEAKKSETMGVLVDWPGEAAHPLQFIFLASESRPPACVAATLAREQQERTREELNALYVAMTRARGTLVVSSLEPHIKSANSWWDRLEGHAQEALGAGPSGAAEPVAGAVQSIAPQLNARQMLVLPPYKKKVPTSLVSKALSATNMIANIVQPAMLVQGEKGADDTPEVRIGNAMHRLLEVLQAEAGGLLQSPWSVEHRASIAQQFLLDDAQAQLAHDMAMGIIRGQASWVWDSDVVVWQGNELGLTHRGRVLRLDRLVQRKDSAEWWVLDYKSSATPQEDALLRTQLVTYRQCVAHIYKGQTVRAAFLTPQGRLIELPQT